MPLDLVGDLCQVLDKYLDLGGVGGREKADQVLALSNPGRVWVKMRDDRFLGVGS